MININYSIKFISNFICRVILSICKIHFKKLLTNTNLSVIFCQNQEFIVMFVIFKFFKDLYFSLILFVIFLYFVKECFF